MDCTKDNKNTLDLEDDAAFWNWGGAWRMPTEDEFATFISDNSYTSGVFTHQGVTFPAAGYGLGAELLNAGPSGSYWSSSLLTDYLTYAFFLFFNGGEVNAYDRSRRYGLPVRPVSGSN